MAIPKSGDIIKHERFLDLAFLVHKVHGPFGNNVSRFKIKGEWVNQAFVKSFPLGIRETLEIPVSKMNTWLICEEPKLKCIRYAKWSYL